jgi:hypothetical protein
LTHVGAVQAELRSRWRLTESQWAKSRSKSLCALRKGGRDRTSASREKFDVFVPVLPNLHLSVETNLEVHCSTTPCPGWGRGMRRALTEVIPNEHVRSLYRRLEFEAR